MKTPTYNNRYDAAQVNLYQQLEDDSCRRFAMRWEIPSEFLDSHKLPFPVEKMLTLIGFKPKVIGNIVALDSELDFSKHTKGPWIKIISPNDIVIIEAHYMPKDQYTTMHSRFTEAGIAMAMAEFDRRQAIRKARPWWDLKRYIPE